jgi:hypothetical protein
MEGDRRRVGRWSRRTPIASGRREPQRRPSETRLPNRAARGGLTKAHGPRGRRRPKAETSWKPATGYVATTSTNILLLASDTDETSQTSHSGHVSAEGHRAGMSLRHAFSRGARAFARRADARASQSAPDGARACAHRGPLARTFASNPIEDSDIFGKGGARGIDACVCERRAGEASDARARDPRGLTPPFLAATSTDPTPAGTRARASSSAAWSIRATCSSTRNCRCSGG